MVLEYLPKDELKPPRNTGATYSVLDRMGPVIGLYHDFSLVIWPSPADKPSLPLKGHMRKLPTAFVLNRQWLSTVVSALLVICALGVPMPSLSQEITVQRLAQQLSVELNRRYSTDEQLSEAVKRAYGTALTADKMNVARNAMRSIVQHEALPIYIAKLVLPIVRSTMSGFDQAAAIDEGIIQSQVKGMLRLPTAKQASYLAFLAAMASALPVDDCKAMGTGRLSTADSSRMERKHTATLPLAQFEAIANLYRDAIVAELSDSPDARALSQAQAKLAESAFEIIATKRFIDNLSKEALERLSKPAEAPASEVCAMLQHTLTSMLEMEEPYRSWQLTRFFQSMQ